MKASNKIELNGEYTVYANCLVTNYVNNNGDTLKLEEVGILSKVISYHNAGGATYTSNDSFQKMLGCKSTKISESIKNLAKYGLITKSQKRVQKGSCGKIATIRIIKVDIDNVRAFARGDFGGSVINNEAPIASVYKYKESNMDKLITEYGSRSVSMYMMAYAWSIGKDLADIGSEPNASMIGFIYSNYIDIDNAEFLDILTESYVCAERLNKSVNLRWLLDGADEMHLTAKLNGVA